MTELKYVGTHQPFGMIVDIKEELVKDLLDSGEYENLNTIKPKKIIKSIKVEKNDSVF